MSPTDFPKVLLVADSAVGDRSGTGITLANLYAQWPTDRLAQVCGRPFSNVRNFADIPTLQVDKSLVPGYGALRTLRSIGQRQSQAPEASGGMKEMALALPPPRDRRSWEKAWLDLTPLRVRRPLVEFVNSFEPDVVVTTSGSVRITRLANMAASVTGAPIVPHFMDDWISTQYRDSLSTLIPRMLLERELRKLFSQATRGLAITRSMGDEYASIFGIPFISVGNLVRVRDAATGPVDRAAGVRLGFIGGLHLGRDEQLLRLARAVDSLSGEATLTVIAPGNAERRSDPEWSGLEQTELRDPVDADRVTECASQFDVLVHVESFEQDQRRYTRLSMSTKISQYMSVGRPVLAIGPEEVASIRYVHAEGVGVTVGDRDEALLAALSELAEPSVREAYGQRAKECALRDFDVAAGTERMRSWLQNV